MTDERGLTVVDHVSLTVRAGEVVAVAGVQGNGQTELAEAVTGLTDRSQRLGPTGRPGPHKRVPAGHCGPASPTSPRTARSTGSCCPCRSPTTWCSTSTTRPPTPASAPGPRRGETGRRAQAAGVRHPGRLGRGRRWALCRGATSKRWWWLASCPGRSPCWSPPSPPGGSTWARSSTSTAGSSTSATGAPACCSCRPSSTRCWRLATGSPSCSGAGSSASSRPARRVSRSA